jgi:hypothetical protein
MRSRDTVRRLDRPPAANVVCRFTGLSGTPRCTVTGLVRWCFPSTISHFTHLHQRVCSIAHTPSRETDHRLLFPDSVEEAPRRVVGAGTRSATTRPAWITRTSTTRRRAFVFQSCVIDEYDGMVDEFGAGAAGQTQHCSFSIPSPVPRKGRILRAYRFPEHCRTSPGNSPTLSNSPHQSFPVLALSVRRVSIPGP